MTSWLAWVAAALELLGIWVVGTKQRYGFLLLLTANLLWVGVALKTGIYGLFTVVIVAGALNIINWKKWRTAEMRGKGFFSWLFGPSISQQIEREANQQFMKDMQTASKQMKALPPFDTSGQCSKCGQYWHEAFLIYCNVPNEHLTIECACGYEREMQCKDISE